MTLHLTSMPMPGGKRLLWGVGPAVEAASFDPRGLASLSDFCKKGGFHSETRP